MADSVEIKIDSSDGGKISPDNCTNRNETDSHSHENGADASSFDRIQNATKDLLGVSRNGHRKSFMEEESAKEKTRVSLLKQCSAILKQDEQKYNKESLHRIFQDEEFHEFILNTGLLAIM
ncbi:unnamed protein product [Leptosia nina]|uniref:Uncharacterized protein n=1 Tax=Leptosia nina TaxID=320188 RepID=A0AAV1JDI1_9NEOP